MHGFQDVDMFFSTILQFTYRDVKVLHRSHWFQFIYIYKEKRQALIMLHLDHIPLLEVD